ncbi:hypothetical protein QCA50_016598 [Cerrena zonata]|uniref:Uncharacterized protein n=1 Tax=Cerrena zonata TaxID=2478898 RepID=A0AAW0FS56_9APHY
MDATPSIPSILGGFIEAIGVSNMLFGLSASQFYVCQCHTSRGCELRICATCPVLLLGSPIEDPLVIADIDWSIPTALVFEMVSEILVQGFYVHRMWIFTRNLYLTIGTIVLFLGRYALFISCIVDTFRSDTWSERESGKPSEFVIKYLIKMIGRLANKNIAFLNHHARIDDGH